MMKEIPFLQHLSPISLDGSGSSQKSDPKKSHATKNNGGDPISNNGARCYTVATIDNGYGDNGANNIPCGAIGLVVREHSSSANSNFELVDFFLSLT